uniref:SH3 domain-containing protein n=1 Tax=Glossina brevipalpis TaxID=37001 RepID=A0A1A9WJW9_9MUSC
MLTCVCRPVSGNLPKMPPTLMPAPRQQRTCNSHMTVVTAEPKLNVPGRLTSAELRAMALRQQQQIDSQHQLLATKEQRLRFLKQQEVRNAVANAEGERLRRLRERVEAQESKLRRLRALRGQVDLQKTYNVTLSNDLDSIRALFSEKEKELSLAVAKVEALTRQLEELRRDRRCPINLIAGGSSTGQPLPPQASRELEKLRRELMYRNQLSLQQDARLHLQREALQQRQAELRSVDQRIYELQTRLQRKKAANVQNTNNQHQHQQQQQQQLHQPPNAKINISPQLMQQATQQLHQPHQPHQQHHQPSPAATAAQTHHNVYNAEVSYSANLAPKTGVAALKQQLLQKQQAASAGQSYTNNNKGTSNKFSNIINRETNRNISRGNVAAVEPYIHTPQKSNITPTASYLGNILKHAAATANTNQQNQLIQDHAHVKLNLTHSQANPTTTNNHLNANTTNTANFFAAESDESKLAKKMLTASIGTKIMEQQTQQAPIASTSLSTGGVTTAPTIQTKPVETDTSHHIYAEVGPKKRDLNKDNATTINTVDVQNSNSSAQQGSKIPKSILSSNTSASISSSSSAIVNKLNNSPLSSQISPNSHQHFVAREKSDLEKKKAEVAVTSETLSEKNTQQLTVHSMPLGTANKSMAIAVSNVTTATVTSNAGSESSSVVSTKPKPLAVPPRKPISSVAPTSVTSSIPKMIPYSPKVNRVAPNVISSNITPAASQSSVAPSLPLLTCGNSERPALPPKPSKMTNHDVLHESSNKKTNPSASTTVAENTATGLQPQNINDNLPIKAKPLTIRKQPLSEQPRLKSTTVFTKPSNIQQTGRKAETSSTSNFPYNDKRGNNSSETGATESANNDNNNNGQQQQAQHSPNTLSPPPKISADETDRVETNAINTNEENKTSPDSLKRRMRSGSSSNNMASSSKPKLTRRVSFDPLALLLDASLEGELELVKKTAMQVANPSAANDEGITALHNAICAGHFDIVKFLVEFGCDVNAQDSDGWTPLHCAASCNNLAMVKFLVENGACLFAATLSDHETPAEKCEEDEEGFDGCSEYLYNIQEKLGILHNGEVFAVFSYEAQNNDELTFNVNDRLTILRKGDDAESEWWWAKNANEEEGYVPRNLLGLYPRVPPQTNNFAD